MKIRSSSPYLSTAQQVAERFGLGGRIIAVKPYGNGLINETFLVTTDAQVKAILQRINDHVFPHPEWIMKNLRTLLDHIRHRQKRGGTSPNLRLPDIFRTREGKDWTTDGRGGFWRAMRYIDQTYTVDAVHTSSQAEGAGFALGRFHALVHDLDPSRLHDTLPGFHVTPHYLRRFKSVLKQADPHLRENPGLDFCLSFIREREAGVDVLERAKGMGLLTFQPTHGDPKINNILFDRCSGEAVGIIDLDTVKPGVIHHDIGDCLRSSCNQNGDDPTYARFDLDICKYTLKGYFRETKWFLKRSDYDYIYEAVWLIALELGLRFLTDHLEGDKYFKTDFSGQNLHRAMVQFHLTADVEKKEKEIRQLISETAASELRR
jgi:hypothetical protein